MKRRTFIAATGMFTGLASLSSTRLFAASTPTVPSPISDGQTATTLLSWPDLGKDWTDGLPLANGTLGLMAWSRAGAVTLSIDRADTWDMRVVPEFEEAGFTYNNLMALRASGNTAEIARLFESPFHQPGRGKLPLGRILLGVASDDVARSSLDLAGGTGMIVLKDTTTITMLVAADAPFGVILVRGPRAAAIAAGLQVESPPFGAPASPPRANRNALDYGGAEDLGYDKPDDLTDAKTSGYASGKDSDHFAVLARTLSTDKEEATIVWTAASGRTRQRAIAGARSILTRAGRAGAIETTLARHRGWWGKFWRSTSVETGNRALDTRWHLSTYHLGAAARVGAPPVPLQSPWTWDNGRLPAWKGDYHHDLNTQMTYWPAYAGNRAEVSANLVDWLWATRGEATRFAESFYSAPGFALPGTADLRNRALGGWAAYSYSPTVTAWLLHHFDLHWRYFGDAQYLRDRAYPYAQGVALFLNKMLKPRQGRKGLFLPVHTSPELNDNKLTSWFDEWTNFDIALCRYAFQTAAEMATALGRGGEAEGYRKTLALLPMFARDADGGFSIATETPLEASHRHFSHLLAFYPLNLLDPATDPDARAALNASLARLERLGTKMWMGYSFAWLASLYAMAGRADDARRALATFEEGFSGRNGFHTNGDRSGHGITAFPGRLFTLEGGSAACASVQECLLQSRADEVRLFPAVEQGASSRFENMRTIQGVIISSTLASGRVVALDCLSREPRTLKVTGPGGFAQTVRLARNRRYTWRSQ